MKNRCTALENDVTCYEILSKIIPQGQLKAKEEEKDRENPELVILKSGQDVVFPFMCALLRTESGG